MELPNTGGSPPHRFNSLVPLDVFGHQNGPGEVHNWRINDGGT